MSSSPTSAPHIPPMIRCGLPFATTCITTSHPSRYSSYLVAGNHSGHLWVARNGVSLIEPYIPHGTRICALQILHHHATECDLSIAVLDSTACVTIYSIPTKAPADERQANHRVADLLSTRIQVTIPSSLRNQGISHATAAGVCSVEQGLQGICHTRGENGDHLLLVSSSYHIWCVKLDPLLAGVPASECIQFLLTAPAPLLKVDALRPYGALALTVSGSVHARVTQGGDEHWSHERADVLGGGIDAVCVGDTQGTQSCLVVLCPSHLVLWGRQTAPRVLEYKDINHPSRGEHSGGNALASTRARLLAAHPEGGIVAVLRDATVAFYHVMLPTCTCFLTHTLRLQEQAATGPFTPTSSTLVRSTQAISHLSLTPLLTAFLASRYIDEKEDAHVLEKINTDGIALMYVCGREICWDTIPRLVT